MVEQVIENKNMRYWCIVCIKPTKWGCYHVEHNQPIEIVTQNQQDKILAQVEQN